MVTRRRYRAFLTYSHRDAGVAKRLHARLERFVIPAKLRDPGSGKYLAPIFRDRDELAASGELSESIQHSLEASAALIVVCSPAAAASRWVNAEIEWFRRCNPDKPIACVIVAGVPGDPNAECFPPALGDRDGPRAEEFAAADLRPGADSRHDAVLRIAASLLDVSFETLRQRNQQRRIRLLLAANIAGSAIALSLAVLAWIAARASEDAERRQAQAEQLVTFMLGDLRSQLEPIGRLDVLDAIGDEASEYFATLEARDETDAVLLSRAKALRQVGDIRLQQGRSSEAAEAFTQALALSEELIRRTPDDPGRLYELAQAEFWVGYAQFSDADWPGAERHLIRYRDLARELTELDADNADYRLELAYANANLGSLSNEIGQAERAAGYFTDAEALIRQLLAADPDSNAMRAELAQVIAWRSTAAMNLGDLARAIAGYEEQARLLRVVAQEQASDAQRQWKLGTALQLLGESLALDDRRKRAGAAFSEARDIFTGLASLDPDNREWQRDVARADWYLGRMTELQGDVEGALERHERAVISLARLVQRDPAQARWRGDLAQALASRLRILREQEHPSWSVVPPEISGIKLQGPRTQQLACELAWRESAESVCEESIAQATEAVQAAPATDAYLTLYSLLRTRQDRRQDKVWSELAALGIRGRAFVDTL